MSTDQIAAALALQKIGKDCGQIARILGIHINTVRAEIDLTYQELCRENMRKMREHSMTLAARKRRLELASRHETRDLTAIFFGDPPFERSALAQKLKGKRT